MEEEEEVVEKSWRAELVEEVEVGGGWRSCRRGKRRMTRNE